MSHTIQTARYDDIRRVFDDMREENRRELEALGKDYQGPGFAMQCFLAECSFVVLRDEVPVAVFGANRSPTQGWWTWMVTRPSFGALDWRATRQGWMHWVIPTILKDPELVVRCLVYKDNEAVMRFVQSLGAAPSDEPCRPDFLCVRWDRDALVKYARPKAAGVH